ncbi:MAG: hypothetical protein V6Z81_08200 [Parvularculales bacterium]
MKFDIFFEKFPVGSRIVATLIFASALLCVWLPTAVSQSRAPQIDMLRSNDALNQLYRTYRLEDSQLWSDVDNLRFLIGKLEIVIDQWEPNLDISEGITILTALNTEIKAVEEQHILTNKQENKTETARKAYNDAAKLHNETYKDVSGFVEKSIYDGTDYKIPALSTSIRLPTTPLKGEVPMLKRLLSGSPLFYGLACLLVFIADGLLYRRTVKHEARRDV